MDDSDCIPRSQVPRIGVPFFGPTVPDTTCEETGNWTSFRDDHANPPASLFNFNNYGNPTAKDSSSRSQGDPTAKDSSSRSQGDATPPRSVTPRPILASPPPIRDCFLDDSFACLTPEGKLGQSASIKSIAASSDEKENEMGEGRPSGSGRIDANARKSIETRLVASDDNANTSDVTDIKSLVKDVQKMRLSATKVRNDATSKKTVQFSTSSSKTKGGPNKNPSASRGVKLYVHGIPGGGTKNSSVIPSVIPKTARTTSNDHSKPKDIPKTVRTTSTSHSKLTSKSSSTHAPSFSRNQAMMKSGYPSSVNSKRPCSSSSSSSNQVVTAIPPSVSKFTDESAFSSRSIASTTAVSTSSIPSARPEPNSILRLPKSSPSLDAERSFDSIAAAEDLLREDSVVRKTVDSKAARRTNVSKGEKVFDNLISLPDPNDVDRLLEEETVRRKAKAKAKTLRSRDAASSSSSRTCRRRNSEVELADRLEPDIRDFWNPEWEIGRPDWSLPFDAANVVVGEEDMDKRAIEQSTDLSDVMRRIEERYERHKKAKNVDHMFFRD